MSEEIMMYKNKYLYFKNLKTFCWNVISVLACRNTALYISVHN